MLNKFAKSLSVLFVMLIAMYSSGCSGVYYSGSTRYLYEYYLSYPVVSNTLFYRDEFIIIEFKMDESAVRFQLQNISNAPISILWEDVSIGLNKRIFAVKNSATFYSNSVEVPHAVVIPPLGYVREIVIPRDNIVFSKNGWVEKDLFPTDDRGSAAWSNAIKKFVGSRISLKLPMQIGGVNKDYTFILRVKKIHPLPENTLPPVKTRPPAPKQVPDPAVSQSIVPMVITAGVLGVAIFLLSQKKTPAGDL